jgi:hypothetical protein
MQSTRRRSRQISEVPPSSRPDLRIEIKERPDHAEVIRCAHAFAISTFILVFFRLEIGTQVKVGLSEQSRADLRINAQDASLALI